MTDYLTGAVAMTLPPTAEPVAVYREFKSAQDARDYRHNKGTGGWIFEPEDGGRSILFPPNITPSDIFYHPLARGRCGRLIGCG